VPLRRIHFLAGLAVVLAGQPFGAAEASDEAASVNDVGITTDEFDDVVASLGEAGLEQFVPSPSSRTIDGQAGRDVLSLLVNNEAARQFLADVGAAPVTEDDLEAVYENPPEGFQTLEGAALTAIAESFLYDERIDAIRPDPATIQEQYEESPTSLGVYCATAVRSDGTESNWQCSQLSTVADPVLLADLVDAEPGESIGPINTPDGDVTLIIDTWEEAAPKLENFFLRLEEAGTDATAGAVLHEGFLFDSDITVDPRFGRWDPTTVTIVALGA
jgi:hypothetical protein